MWRTLAATFGLRLSWIGVAWAWRIAVQVPLFMHKSLTQCAIPTAMLITAPSGLYCRDLELADAGREQNPAAVKRTLPQTPVVCLDHG